MLKFSREYRKGLPNWRRIFAYGVAFSLAFLTMSAFGVPLHVGTYSTLEINTGLTTGPTANDGTTPLSDGIQGAEMQFQNATNQLDWKGVELVFDLGDSYTIEDMVVHSNAHDYFWGIGKVDFYYSTNGVDYTFLGRVSEGDYVRGPGSFYRIWDSPVTATHIKIHVFDYGWLMLSVCEVELNVTPDPENLSMPKTTISGLDGARHWIWVEGEAADALSEDFLLTIPGGDHLSGYDSDDPCVPHAVQGNYNDTWAYSRDVFALPADMENMTLYAFYGSLNSNSNILAWWYWDWTDQQPEIYFDATSDPCDPCELGSVPRLWTDPFSIGPVTGGDHYIALATGGTYNELSIDGLLVCDGLCVPGEVSAEGPWHWRGAPFVDPNTTFFSGTSIVATVEVTGPVDEGYIRVDDEVVESFTDPGVFVVPISGMGDHFLEVETFAHPYDPCQVFDPCNPNDYVTRGRVLAGASLRLMGCSGSFLTGDLNEDCYVNLSDLVLISNDWMYDHSSDPNCGVTYPFPGGDADNDCVVNMIDAALLGSDWLECNDPCGPCP
ncbi:MAG: hypothetical protein JW936_09195 [Sedimentisphaerales bacterium]|nr:hypothetical protein [Sedimentisphaerales bacterium]